MQQKTSQIMLNIESLFSDLIEEISSKEGISKSSYLRSLVISDLLERGLIDHEKLIKMFK